MHDVMYVVTADRPLTCKWKYFNYFLIAVTSWLDALDARKNVLQPMGIRWSMVIKRFSQMGYTV